MTRYTLSIIPGDGIGKEVVPAAIEVLDAVGALFDIGFGYRHFEWSCETYKSTGRMMPPDGLARLGDCDAILLGAVGYPGVPDHVSLWGLLIPIRRGFDQYVNFRPVHLLEGVASPLRDKTPGDIDFLIVRENSEGEYSQLGGRRNVGLPDEICEQTAVFSRKGVDRIVRHAFELARRTGRKRVTSATKSNGIFHSMPYWDERFTEIAGEYPEIAADSQHIDILCARLVMQPEAFDVIVGSNLFGDIVSDLGPALTGTIAMAPSANINPERVHPSMFEPVHGSAPDIAGQGIANPVGQIWSAAMLLDYLGEQSAATHVLDAIKAVLADPASPKTRDLGGTASTAEMTGAIVGALQRPVARP